MCGVAHKVIAVYRLDRRQQLRGAVRGEAGLPWKRTRHCHNAVVSVCAVTAGVGGGGEAGLPWKRTRHCHNAVVSVRAVTAGVGGGGGVDVPWDGHGTVIVRLFLCMLLMLVLAVVLVLMCHGSGHGTDIVRL